MKVKQISPNVYHVTTKKAVDLAQIFMRFQEHYESPKFQGKIFSVREYKDWYRTTRDHKRFSYNTDWSGFNIPSSVLTPFLEGKFNPLTKKEKSLLKCLSGAIKSGENFYVIGTSKEKERVITHELGHALFFTNKTYAQKATDLIKKSDTKKFNKWLKDLGYAKSVWVDEICAYATHNPDSLKEKGLFDKDLHKKLKALFEKHWV